MEKHYTELSQRVLLDDEKKITVSTKVGNQLVYVVTSTDLYNRMFGVYGATDTRTSNGVVAQIALNNAPSDLMKSSNGVMTLLRSLEFNPPAKPKKGEAPVMAH